MAAASSDSASLEIARGKIDDCFQSIDGLRKGLVDYTQENASQWTGQSAEVFRQVIGLTDEKLHKIQEALDTLGQNVGASAKSYANNEESQQQTMSKFDNLLNF